MAGFLVTFGFLAMFSIGAPFLLASLFLIVWLSKRGSVWPAQVGLIAGAGAVCLVIALISAAAGDISPTWWIVSGLGLIASSSIAFWWMRCRPSR